MSTKNPVTPAGIEPATFQFVARHLNHCATAVPKITKIQFHKYEHIQNTKILLLCAHIYRTVF